MKYSPRSIQARSCFNASLHSVTSVSGFKVHLPVGSQWNYLLSTLYVVQITETNFSYVSFHFGLLQNHQNSIFCSNTPENNSESENSLEFLSRIKCSEFTFFTFLFTVGRHESRHPITSFPVYVIIKSQCIIEIWCKQAVFARFGTTQSTRAHLQTRQTVHLSPTWRLWYSVASLCCLQVSGRLSIHIVLCGLLVWFVSR